MINFKSVPFFKITLPYVLGILFTVSFGILKNFDVLLLIAFCFCIVTFSFQKYYKPIFYFKKVLFISSTFVFLFLLAQATSFLYKASNQKHFYGNHITQKPQSIIATITDVPIYTSKYVKLQIELNCIEENKKWNYVTGHTIVYLKNTKQDLSIGNKIYLKAIFNAVHEPLNPHEFNYKGFLENKNIFHVIYTKQASVIHNTAIVSVGQLATIIKANVITILKQSGLTQTAFSICAALLVGYDDEIDNSTMQSFSHSGTLHVLSVSGMHTGLLYGVLLFLFGLFDKHNKYKKLKCIVLILSLTLFCFITGLSPSVLRAALMLSLIIIGETFYKQGNSYNTLLLSAFLLLLINPFLIVDVGFLLSYLAVFGIMYLNPILTSWYYFDNKLLQKCWSLTTMSISATVFTLPICLYVFHQFPIWFALSNLIIIPMSVGLMALSFIILCFYKIILVKNALVFLVNILAKSMLWVAQLTDSKTYGYIDYIAFDKIDLIFCFICIYVALKLIEDRQYKTVLLGGTICIIWLSYTSVIMYTQLKQKELIVFHVNKKSAFAFRNGTIIYGYFKELTDQEYSRFVKPYICTISDVNTVNVNHDVITTNYTKIQHHNTAAISSSDIDADYIIISNNTLPYLEHHRTKLVIADCSNNYKFVKKLEEYCIKKGLAFYSVKEKGALQIKL